VGINRFLFANDDDDDDDGDADDAVIQTLVIGRRRVCCWLQAILVTLERDENGLGFTIAGGHGSTPYRGNDQVTRLATLPARRR